MYLHITIPTFIQPYYMVSGSPIQIVFTYCRNIIVLLYIHCIICDFPTFEGINDLNYIGANKGC